MRSLNSLYGSGVSLLAGVTTSPALVPPTPGVVTDWNGAERTVPEFDLEIWAASAVSLSAAALYGASTHSLVVVDFDLGSVTFGSDILTKSSHGLLTGDGPLTIASSGTLPDGLTAGTSYWVVYASSSTFKLATSLANALNGVVVDLTTNGSGTITLSDLPTTARVYWHLRELLGTAGDGAISLDTQIAYVVRCKHSPRMVAYTIVATLGSAVATSARVFPITEV